MKNIILFMLVIITMAACQSKTDLGNVPGQSQMPVTPVYNNSALSDTAKIEEAFYPPPKFKNRSAQAPARPLPTAVHRNRYPQTTSLPPVQTSPVVTTPVPASTVPASTGVGTNPSAGTASTIPQPQKKGWSKAAKGAVIGAGAGAIGGAIFSKKKKNLVQ